MNTERQIQLLYEERIAQLHLSSQPISEHHVNQSEVIDETETTELDIEALSHSPENADSVENIRGVSADAEVDHSASETSADGEVTIPTAESGSPPASLDGVYRSELRLRRYGAKYFRGRRTLSEIGDSQSTSPSPTTQSKYRRTTYDVVMGVISPDAHSALIESHEKKKKTSKEKDKIGK